MKTVISQRRPVQAADAATMELFLQTLLTSEAAHSDSSMVVESAVPFKESGVMTKNAGLTVKMEDGTTFQIQIVKA